MKVLVSKSKTQKYQVQFSVSDSDTLHSVMSLLSRMNRDCIQGHSATYIGDADGDGRFSVGVDGDGNAFVGDIKLKEEDGNFKKVDANEYLLRGEYEFANGIDTEGNKVFNLKPQTQILYKGEKYILDYNSSFINLYHTPKGHKGYNPKPVHSIRWSDYLKRPYVSRHKMFKTV